MSSVRPVSVGTVGRGHRRRLALLAVVLSLGCLSMTGGAATAQGAVGGVWMAGPGCASHFEWLQHPRGFGYLCGGLAGLERVHWTDWGRQRATAKGTMNEAALNGHNAIEGAPRRRSAVTIVASQIEVCGGRRAYTRVVIKFHKAVDGIKTLQGNEYLPKCSTSGVAKMAHLKEFRVYTSGGGSIVCSVGGAPAETEALCVGFSQEPAIEHWVKMGGSGGIETCSQTTRELKDPCGIGNAGIGIPVYRPGRVVEAGPFVCEVLTVGVQCLDPAAGAKGFLFTPSETTEIDG